MPSRDGCSAAGKPECAELSERSWKLNTLDDSNIAKPMPDLYAVNLRLQQRLKLNWR